jgi:alpha,alpha-trehalase
MILVLLAALNTRAQVAAPLPPDQLYGELFSEVQRARIFPDGKTFADAIPRRDPAEILKAYRAVKKNPAIRFSLAKFVEENFQLPPVAAAVPSAAATTDINTHLKNLWKQLERQPDQPVKGSSLLALPYPYIVPGGRFREIYYWDAYFTMLGLKEAGEIERIEQMIRNFAYLIDTYGHIPNGNRSYYLSRSQPPFFAMMIELLAGSKGDQVYVQFLPQLEKEYRYWMEGVDSIKAGRAYKSVVKLPDGSVLNRYWDELAIPRQESYREDLETALQSGRNKAEVYRDLRAGAASGWDFSSRWLGDRKTLKTIETTQIIPVDLNSLLYEAEIVLARAHLINKEDSASAGYIMAAEKRRQAVDTYCWSESLHYYTDYHFRKKRLTNVVSAAGLFPFCFFPQRQGYLSVLGRQAAVIVHDKLLQPGGLLSTDLNTGQQWDAPNGWAPLQWMAVQALARSGQIGLAKEIALRWLALNEKVYSATGKMMEKYNVADINLSAGGGEYPSQDGFGWTNGVYLALQAWLKQ